MGFNSPKTISELVDALERIQQELFVVQEGLEKWEQADIAGRATDGKKKKVVRRVLPTKLPLPSPPRIREALHCLSQLRHPLRPQ